MAEDGDAVAAVAARGIVLLGCGKMGSAMLAGWLERGLDPAQVHVIDPAPSDWLVSTGVGVHGDLPEAPAVLLIAVKPQILQEALPSVQHFGNGQTIVISVAAGIGISAFEAAFGASTPIVRAMPNTPAAVGAGVTALAANDAAGEAGLRLAEGLLDAIGTTIRLESEAQMDAVTGLSGSGPAYVFHLVEAMAAAGEAEGLDPELAMELARRTVIGAGALLRAADESAAQLRTNVTSPNGTTAAGLDVLMPELPDLMRRTVAAAARRSKELGA